MKELLELLAKRGVNYCVGETLLTSSNWGAMYQRTTTLCGCLVAALSIFVFTPSIAAAPSTDIDFGNASFSENRSVEGGRVADEPVCPAGSFRDGGFGSYGGRRASEYEGACVGLHPRYVKPDGTLDVDKLNREAVNRNTRENSWTINNENHRGRELIDIWAVAYFFEGTKFPGKNYYKLCGCFRDYARNGCFHPETNITMADGSQKEIQDIAAGEQVYNPLTKTAAKVINVIQGPERLPLMEVTVGSTTLRMTTLHPVLVFSSPEEVGMTSIALVEGNRDAGRLVQAIDLKVGDLLLLADGSKAPISSIVRPEVEEGQFVYNLVLESTDRSGQSHMLVSDGVVTGDFILQGALAQHKAQ